MNLNKGYTLKEIEKGLNIRKEIKKEMPSEKKEFFQRVGYILRDNIYFSHQTGGYIIHGAIEKLWEMFNEK